MSDLITIPNAIATVAIAAVFYLAWCIALRWAFNFYFHFRVGSSYNNDDRKKVADEVQWTRSNKQSKARAFRDGRRQYKHHQIGLNDLIYLRLLALTAKSDCWTAEHLAKRYIGDAFYAAIPELASKPAS